jgi:glycosyltransferase involved in cell wall biosynthesis
MLRFSIVTPSKDSATTLERTISSIRGQNDKNLQYIVVDGGSHDATSEIIQTHRDVVSEYISEPDQGQYHAIEKGFSLADGDIFAWVNSDDFYLPWAFSVAREIFSLHPDVRWIMGLPTVYNEYGQCVSISRICAYPQSWISKGLFNGRFANYLQQESMFWRRGLWEESGGLNCDFKLAADFELWTRFARLSDLVVIAIPVGGFTRRSGGQQRSIAYQGDYEKEVDDICRKLPVSIIQRIVGGNRYSSELYRQLNSRKCRFAVYDAKYRKWRLVSTRMVVSQNSILNYLKEWLYLRH